MKQTNFDEVTDRTGTYCTQWDYIEDRFGEKIYCHSLSLIQILRYPRRLLTH